MCKIDIKNGDRRIDPCMRTFVKQLGWYIEPRGIRIVSCCCGHNKYPMTILVKGEKYREWGFRNPFSENEEIVQDLFSGKIIPRKRNFYKRDKKGIYYIPEVVGGKNGI